MSDIRQEDLSYDQKLRVIEPFKGKPYKEASCISPANVKNQEYNFTNICNDHKVLDRFKYLFFLDKFDESTDTCCSIHSECYEGYFKDKQVLESKTCDDLFIKCVDNAYENTPFSISKLNKLGMYKKMKSLMATRGFEMYNPSGINCETSYNTGIVI